MGPRGRLDAATEAALIGWLTEARGALVQATAGLPRIQAAGLRSWDLWIHTGQLTGSFRWSLLIGAEGPEPVRVPLHALHDRVGCPRDARLRDREPPAALAAAFAALPLRPSWLAGQLDRAPDQPGLATARAAAERWLAARNAVVDALLGFVVALAHRVPTGPVPLEDRVQAGALAVTVALERFDPGRGTRLTTYLAPVVARALRRLGRAPWASHVDGSGPVHGRGRCAITLVTLDTRAEDVARSLAERLVEPASPTPEDRAILTVDGARAGAALARLRPAEQAVLRLLFGLGGDDAIGVRAAAGRVGVSAATVRRIRDRALAALRRALMGADPCAPPSSCPFWEVWSCPILCPPAFCSSSTSPSGPGARRSARPISAWTPRASPPTTRSAGNAWSRSTPSIPSGASSAKRATPSTA
jgi:RNA polymerase sigma factor (sigma-70 family)